MFAGVINQAKAAVSHLVLKYVARASVAIPFVIALGFAIAAIAMMLVERFGHVMGYWLMAGGLAAIGIVAALAVSVKEHEDEVAEHKAEQTDTKDVVSDATAQAMMQAPLALLGAAFTAPGGASAVFKVARTLGRNWPLVLLVMLIGGLFWPPAEADASSTGTDEAKPNGVQPVETLH